MDHADVFRQNSLQAVAADNVRVTAAELHEPIVFIRPRFFSDIGNELFCELFVTVLSDVLHAGSPAAGASEAKRASVF